MDEAEIEQQWEQDGEEMEEGLIKRGKTKILNQAAELTTNGSGNSDTASNGNDNGYGELRSNNGGSMGVINGETEEEEEEEVKVNFSQQNGTEVDEEDEKEKQQQQQLQQQKSQYSVYLDTEKGIWKCRICSWDYEGRTCFNGHTQSPSFIHETKGTELHPESFVLEKIIDVTRQNEENENELKLNPVINNENEEHKSQENFSSIQPSERLIQELDKSFYSYENNKTDDTEVIKDDEHEVTEFDVENVIKNQETHDLFCPNCHSCITKRVILRKRKRIIRTPGEEDAKRNKPSEINVVSNDDEARNGGDVSLDDSQSPESIEDDHQREPDVFRCLSCFSIFMPTGNGFKLFRMFGDKSERQKNQSSQKAVRVKKGWFSSIFSSDKTDKSTDKKAAHSSDVETNVPQVSIQYPSLEEPNDLASSRQEANLQVPMVIEPPIVDEPKDTTKKSNGEDTFAQLIPSYHIESNGKSDHQEMPLKHQQNGLKLLVPTNAGSLIAVNSQMNQNFDVTVQSNTQEKESELYQQHIVQNNVEIHLSEPQKVEKDVLTSPTHDALLLQDKRVKLIEDLKNTETTKDSTEKGSEVYQQHIVQNNVEIHLPEPQKVEKDAFTSPTHDALLLQDKRVKLIEDFKNIETTKGRDTIITIEGRQHDISTTQRLADNGTGVGQDIESGNRTGEEGLTMAREGHSVEIIKSVVYGGLIETIASLSVVSSAAGAEAATLNVLALGLANIFGGLFVIGHDLWDLKNERPRGALDEMAEHPDRYQQLLGQRVNFPLHMAIALLSYFIFGSLPPVIYAFSFRESNARDLKLLMVAAVSILCVVTLAVAKTYIQRPPKSYIKTISYYLVFGFVVSGVSCVFGNLIMTFLEKIDVFHSGSMVNLDLRGVSSNPALRTY